MRLDKGTMQRGWKGRRTVPDLSFGFGLESRTPNPKRVGLRTLGFACLGLKSELLKFYL